MDKLKGWIIATSIVLLLGAPASFSGELSAMGENLASDGFLREKEKRISMDFENAALKDMLKAFSRQAEVNFIASDIIEGKVITVYLNNVSIEEALSSILEANGLGYEKQEGNVYLIKPAGTAAIRTITRVYRLDYIQVYDMTLQTEGEGFISTAELTGEASAASNSATTSMIRPAGNEEAKNIITVIKSLLSTHGKVVANKRTNSLVITDIPGSFQAIEKTIKELDVEPIQIMIQAEIIETTTTALKRIGVEYGSLTQTAGFTYGDLVANTTFPLTANFVQDLFRGVLGGTGDATTSPDNFTWGTLTAADTAIVLKLISTDDDTKYLSRPRILTINNEPAIIKVSANTSIGVNTVNLSETQQTIETAERVETGVVLKAIPQVNDKGDIFMYLEPSIARAAISTFFSSQFMDPQVRSASSTVMVRDGETIVIAGLIKTDNFKTIRKIPFLGDIPVLGEIFKSGYKQTEDTEILIFVTPHIVKKRGDEYVIPEHVLERERIIRDTLERYGKKKE